MLSATVSLIYLCSLQSVQRLVNWHSTYIFNFNTYFCVSYHWNRPSSGPALEFSLSISFSSCRWYSVCVLTRTRPFFETGLISRMFSWVLCGAKRILRNRVALVQGRQFDGVLVARRLLGQRQAVVVGRLHAHHALHRQIVRLQHIHTLQLRFEFWKVNIGFYGNFNSFAFKKIALKLFLQI